MFHENITVFKVGGSLLKLPNLKSRLEDAIALCNAENPLLVIGGGSLTDFVHSLQAIHNYNDSTGHRLAIQALQFNSYLVEAFFKQSEVVDDYQNCQRLWANQKIPILNPFTFLSKHSKDGLNSIPASWSFTTDSISAKISEILKARELVLLKSVNWSTKSNILSGVQKGYIDPYFEQYSKTIPALTWINLRSTVLTSISLRSV
ncbi:MAG: hypothetical protein O2857_08225 [Planctomycetota bacterium]|nr:hypothetical protein [Planctomycetota bacterium]